MNEEFEKKLMISVRGQLLINWVNSLKDLCETPFEDFKRFHRKIFVILVMELLEDGNDYCIKQIQSYTKKNNKTLIEFFSNIHNSIKTLKDDIPEDEYIYLSHLRNNAAHIFPVAYDFVDIDGNAKTYQKIRVKTKNGLKEFTLIEITNILEEVALRYGVDDRIFLKIIYMKVVKNMVNAFETTKNY